MEQIIVNKKNGTALLLMGYQPARGVTKAEQYRQLLGEDTVQITVESSGPMDFGIGDYVLAFGERYTLNQLPAARKTSENRFIYELSFEGSQYALLRVLYFNTDVTGFNTSTEFSLTGDLTMFMNVLINNIGRALTGWSLGSVAVSTTKNLSFSNENCLAVLQKLCKEFETEFSISYAANGNRTLTVGKIGQVLGQQFEYGRGKGLYSLKRQTVSDKEFITRLYAYGGTRNIPASYRNFSPRLQLASAGSFLEKATAKAAFGLIEGVKLFDEIYPHRTGKVSALGGDGLTFTDGSMDFDLMAASGPAVGGKPNYTYLSPGVTAKVHFNTGNLAGYEFDIKSYAHSSKTFVILPFTDERGQAFPAPGAFAIKAGDEYVLVDIIMPASYVTAAEAQLLTAAQAFLDANAAPRVQYALDIDEMYLADRSPSGSETNFFSLGDTVSVLDADLGVSGGSRIVSFRRELLSPYNYKLEIADSYDISLIQRILDEQTEVRSIIRVNDLRDARSAKYGYQIQRELLETVFDTDGYYDPDRIKPLSIETAMLSVGSRSQQFVLNVVIEPNYAGNPNVVVVNAGTLTHYTIEETIRTWQIVGQTVTLDTGVARYIYARCSLTNYSDGQLVFSLDQIRPLDSATHYHFLIGVLHKVSTDINIRWISLTYGTTTINGRFIKTGRVQSADGKTYFDLDAGEIGGKVTFLSSSGAKKQISEVDDLTGTKRRVFVTTPVVPYDVGDLWTNGQDLFRCETAKARPALFALSDWQPATYYDNTQTTIDGGIVTSGRIQLAGEGGSIKAGITGYGVAPESVRIWAGAAYANRTVAPFRVLDSGETFVRKRFELMNQNNVGQAGICGSNIAADGLTRFWAGSPYEGRATAPFQVNSDGSMVATKGSIGSWVISGDGIVNNDGSGYVIARSNLGANRTEARIGANVFPATFGGKGAAAFYATKVDVSQPNFAATFQASGGSENFAVYAPIGTSLLGEALINGRRYYGRAITDVTLVIDPSQYDVIEVFPQGTSAGLKFETGLNTKTMRNGKQLVIFNSNDGMNAFFLSNIIRGTANWRIDGGVAVTLMWSNGYWNCISRYDNTYGATAAPFVGDTTGTGSGRVEATTGTGSDRITGVVLGDIDAAGGREEATDLIIGNLYTSQ